jgi:uncharacterized protein
MMANHPCAHIRFHGELIALAARRGRPHAFPYTLTRKASVKDILEALGTPHTEIYRLVVNGLESDFSYIPAAGDQVEAFPGTPPVDPCKPTRLRPDPLPCLRFLVDVNVSKLAMLLRLIDYDAAVPPKGEKRMGAELAALAETEQRFLLTRDAALLKRSRITHGRLIRAGDPEEQLIEVMRFFGIKPPLKTFRRCLRCNVPLEPVEKSDALHLLEPKTKKYFEEFHRCPACERIYWPGSHHEAMLGRMREILDKLVKLQEKSHE